jgi:hypothetical protein
LSCTAISFAVFPSPALGAGPQRALGVQRFVVHRTDEDLQAGVQGGEVLDEIEAATAGHREIGDDEIGAHALHGDERLGHAGRESAHREVGLGIDH